MADSSQLIAFIFLLLSLITVIDPSHFVSDDALTFSSL